MRSSHYFKAISRILIFAMLHLCWFSSYGYAEMIPTESANQVQNDRQRILDLLDRQDVVDELDKYGISKVEAVARINSLTDEEVTQIAGRLDELPPGGIVKEFTSILAGLFFLVIAIPMAILCVLLGGTKDPDQSCADHIIFPLKLIVLHWKWTDDCPYAPDGTRICVQPWDYNKSGPESSDEMQEATQCYSKCFDNYHACINSDDEDSPPESQCEEDKQMCFRQCEGDYETDEPKGSTYKSDPIEHDDCDPGMESCD